MTAFVTLLAVGASLLGLAYLTASDPKRQRAFNLQPRSRRFVLPACGLAFTPGLALLIAGEGAAFVMWLGTVSIAGWRIAARAPSAVVPFKSE